MPVPAPSLAAAPSFVAAASPLATPSPAVQSRAAVENAVDDVQVLISSAVALKDHQSPVAANSLPESTVPKLPVSVAEPLAPEAQAALAPVSSETATPALVPGGVPPIRRTSAFSLAHLQTPEIVPNTASSASNATENPEAVAGAPAPIVPVEVRPAKRNNTYHLGDLRRVWAEYVASLANQPAVQALLESMVVEVDPEHRVQLTVSNAIQEKYTAEQRDSMLQFLREGLQNDSIDIVVDISREAAAKVVYTPDERFAYLAEKNPLLHNFRQTFQLDIE